MIERGDSEFGQFRSEHIEKDHCYLSRFHPVNNLASLYQIRAILFRSHWKPPSYLSYFIFSSITDPFELKSYKRSLPTSVFSSVNPQNQFEIQENQSLNRYGAATITRE
jgi:hypothetical protein